MLIDAKTLLIKANNEGYAVGGFNTYNLEITLGILRAAQECNAPVILQVGASALEYGGLHPLSRLALTAAERARTPVAVHLDHARDLDLIQACLDLSYTSVMFDGSNEPFQENISMTREAVTLARASGVPIEAELGAITGDEDGDARQARSLPFTDPEKARTFIEVTGVDSLAVAIGNSHGFYKDEPKLDFERLEAIHGLVSVPLVLHGASGIPDPDLQRAIGMGVCKVNVNTELRRAFFQSLADRLEGRQTRTTIYQNS